MDRYRIAVLGSVYSERSDKHPMQVVRFLRGDKLVREDRASQFDNMIDANTVALEYLRGSNSNVRVFVERVEPKEGQSE